MSLKIKVGFIGFGRMGSALARGAVASGVLKKKQISAFDPDPQSQKKIKASGFHASTHLLDVLLKSDLVFLCVKPQKMDEVLVESAPFLRHHKKQDLCLVSIAAGVPLSKLEARLGRTVPLLRVMPNTPALLNCGMSAVSRGKASTSRHEKWVHTILEGVGAVVNVPEKFMDAVTALSGSGPAYVFYLTEAMKEAGIKLGLASGLARQLAHQTVYGAGMMLKKLPEEAGALRVQVTSPGGTTEAAIREFDFKKMKPLIFSAIQKAALRSKELSRR